MEEDALARQTVVNWFRRFRKSNFDVKDTLHSGQSIVKNVNEIFQKIEKNRCESNYDIGAKELNIDYKIVLEYLRKIYKEARCLGAT